MDPHGCNGLGINGGIHENAVPLGLLTVQEEDVARHGEGLPQTLLNGAVL